MLPEQINYEKNLPFAIGFSNVAKEPPHYHREMEMALILRGTASYRIHHQKYQLSAGDVIIVDTGGSSPDRPIVRGCSHADYVRGSGVFQ